MVDIFFSASQPVVARNRSVISISLPLVFLSFDLLTLANVTKHLIYISICSSSSSFVKSSINDAIVKVCIFRRVDVDLLIRLARPLILLQLLWVDLIYIRYYNEFVN